MQNKPREHVTATTAARAKEAASPWAPCVASVDVWHVRNGPSRGVCVSHARMNGLISRGCIVWREGEDQDEQRQQQPAPADATTRGNGADENRQDQCRPISCVGWDEVLVAAHAADRPNGEAHALGLEGAFGIALAVVAPAVPADQIAAMLLRVPAVPITPAAKRVIFVRRDFIKIIGDVEFITVKQGDELLCRYRQEEQHKRPPHYCRGTKGADEARGSSERGSALAVH